MLLFLYVRTFYVSAPPAQQQQRQQTGINGFFSLMGFYTKSVHWALATPVNECVSALSSLFIDSNEFVQLESTASYEDDLIGPRSWKFPTK